MAQEIERKFLVRNDSWKTTADGGTRIAQAFLSKDPPRIVRVRIMGDDAFLTVKGLPPTTKPLETPEFEYPIPQHDAQQLLKMCLAGEISKTRYRVLHQKKTWEIDVFDGANAGLVIAELELQSSDETFTAPDWLGEEVTADPRYKNARLSQSPFSSWDRQTG